MLDVYFISSDVFAVAVAASSCLLSDWGNLDEIKAAAEAVKNQTKVAAPAAGAGDPAQSARISSALAGGYGGGTAKVGIKNEKCRLMLSRRRRQQNHGSESPRDFRLPGKPDGRGGLVHRDSCLAHLPVSASRESSLKFEKIVQAGLMSLKVQGIESIQPPYGRKIQWFFAIINMVPLFVH